MKIFIKAESEKWDNRYKNAHTLIIKEMVLLKPLKLPPDIRTLKVHLWQGCGVIRMFVHCWWEYKLVPPFWKVL